MRCSRRASDVMLLLLSFSFADCLPSLEKQIPCALGQLPGTFVEGAPAGGRFQLLSSECQLQNLLEKHSRQRSTASRQQVSILMLGDSVDWRANGP